MMVRRALVVGIDDYTNFPSLSCASSDAEAIATLLQRNDDESINYSVRLFTSKSGDQLSKSFLRNAWIELFHDFDGDILFYFSGHGAQSPWGAQLVTVDGTHDDLGVSMEDLLLIANRSKARDVVLVIDCCHAGELGNPPIIQGLDKPLSLLREGVTVLAASRPNEVAYEVDGHGMFTHAIIEGLQGGAADLMGTVTAASLFIYAERLFDAWDQCPVYKSHTGRVTAIRSCRPPVDPEDLRRITEFFDASVADLQLDPEYESDAETDEEDPQRAKKREACRLFKRLRDARLVESCDGKDLYWTAMESGAIRLTALGRYYWRLLDLKKM
jgi:hypothetical protein